MNRIHGCEVMAKKGLWPKQQLFVDEYLIDLNATQAAIRAGYSKKTAHDIGCENLKKPNIAKEIQKAMEERSARTEITQDMVIKELARLAFFDIRKLYDKDGDLIPIHQLPEEVAAAIGGVDASIISFGDKEDEITTTKKIKIIDKKGSLELLGKHLKMFTDKVQFSGSVALTGVDIEFVDS